jgi:hypothetical protein
MEYTLDFTNCDDPAAAVEMLTHLVNDLIQLTVEVNYCLEHGAVEDAQNIIKGLHNGLAAQSEKFH